MISRLEKRKSTSLTDSKSVSSTSKQQQSSSAHTYRPVYITTSIIQEPHLIVSLILFKTSYDESLNDFPSTSALKTNSEVVWDDPVGPNFIQCWKWFKTCLLKAYIFCSVHCKYVLELTRVFHK